MLKTKALNRHIAAIANGLLLVWWGIVIIVDPIKISMGAVGTGLILLGVNVIRLLNGVKTKRATTSAGLIALLWGALAFVIAPGFWASLALLLIIVGLIEIVSLLARPQEKLSEAG